MLKSVANGLQWWITHWLTWKLGPMSKIPNYPFNATLYQLRYKEHQHLTFDQWWLTNSGTSTPMPRWWSCNDGRGSYLRTLWPHTMLRRLWHQRTCRSWWTFLPFPNTWQSESSSLGHRWWWHTWGKETHKRVSYSMLFNNFYSHLKTFKSRLRSWEIKPRKVGVEQYLVEVG